jgi:hypothetical protein
MSTISIEVDEVTAKAYDEATPAQQKKIQLLLRLGLKEFMTGPKKSLRLVMDEMSAEAQARGLTPEILESLLRDE